jgi:CHAD domain-containing protein
VNPYPPQPQQPPQVPVQTAYPNVAPQPAFDPNYLDSIAPAPPRTKFLSGSFGKFFFILLGVFVLAVSLIIAFSGKDKTADLQQIAVRLDDFSKTVKTVQTNLSSNNLSATNTNFQIWITNAKVEAEDLLGKGGVKKTDYDKKMVASEKTIMEDLDAKFEDARLNATLNRVYANTMASETEKLINLFNTMAKKSGSAAIRDYAKKASSNLTPIQKSFESFNDDGN